MKELIFAGNKVKVNVRFKGREMLRVNHSHVLLDKIKQACSDYGSLEKPGKLEGRSFNAILVPKPQKQSSSPDVHCQTPSE